MKRIWIAGAAVALTLAGAFLWSQMHMELPAPEKVELGAPELVLPMAFFGPRPVVQVKINGKGPYPFIFDSGAAGTVISSQLATELGLPVRGDAAASSPGGTRVAAQVVRIEKLELGSAVLSGVTVVAVDLGLMGQDGPKGALSFNLLPKSVVTFDYPQSKITVRRGELPATDGKTVLEYDVSDRLPTVTLDVAGTPVRAHLDSGANVPFLLPAAVAAQVPLIAQPVEAPVIRRVGNEIKVTRAQLKGAIHLGQYAFENPEVRFGDPIPIGNVGGELLRGFVISFDRDNQRVRLVRP
jgi:hypothetical protein